jgi:hypothetical protein
MPQERPTHIEPVKLRLIHDRASADGRQQFAKPSRSRGRRPGRQSALICSLEVWSYERQGNSTTETIQIESGHNGRRLRPVNATVPDVRRDRHATNRIVPATPRHDRLRSRCRTKALATAVDTGLARAAILPFGPGELRLPAPTGRRWPAGIGR